MGEDQIQHIELACDLITRYNSIVEKGKEFPLPKPLKSIVPKVLNLRDPSKKMAKSENNELTKINLTDSDDEIRLKISKAKTDSIPGITYEESERPGLANLLRIYSALTQDPIDRLVEQYNSGSIEVFKKELTEILVQEIAPIRENIMKLNQDRPYVLKLLAQGQKIALEESSKNMIEIKKSMGLC